MKVNTAMLEFYWSIGRDIIQRKAESKWGSGFFNQMSLDLREMFPNATGFSVTNLKYMKRWYAFYYESDAIRQRPVDEFVNGEKRQRAIDQMEMPEIFGQIPWGQHIDIITRCQSLEEALFYIKYLVENGWSRPELNAQIDANLYVRQGSAASNFKRTLPDRQRELAQEMLKDPYDFSFLRQMELRMDDETAFFPDLVFYHIPQKRYVIIELKAVKFMPEFAGKLNFYVTAADKMLRGSDDNPSVGLLICKTAKKTIVEWSLQDIQKPLGVATYQLQEVVNRTIAEMEQQRKDKDL